MKESIKNVILISIILFDVVARGENEDNGMFKERTNNTWNKLQGMEVPDSALILIDRLKFYTTDLTSHARHRGKQTEQNTTTTTPTSESGRPCSCALGICKCCTGYVLDLFNQKACMKITYHPGDFAFDVAMSLNDRVLYENSMTGKNPQPICISPPRLSNLKVCAKIYDVYFPGRNFHFCLAMNGQWRSLQLFNMAFDCLRMGANGIAMLKPGESDGLVVVNPTGGYDAVVDAGEDDIEDYDENVVKSLLSLFDR